MTPDSSLLMSSSAFSRRDIASMACSCWPQHLEAFRVADHAAQGAVQQAERLQRLTQIMARGGEKAALGERWRVRLRGARRAAPVRPALRSVTSRIAAATMSSSPCPIGLRLISTGNSRAVLAHAEQLEAHAHGPHAHVARVTVAVRRVPRAKAFGQQHLDGGADHLVARIAEQRRHLAIGEQDRPRGVDDDHRVRGRVENAPDELGREHAWRIAEWRVRGRIASAVLHRKGLRRRLLMHIRKTPDTCRVMHGGLIDGRSRHDAQIACS